MISSQPKQEFRGEYLATLPIFGSKDPYSALVSATCIIADPYWWIPAFSSPRYTIQHRNLQELAKSLIRDRPYGSSASYLDTFSSLHIIPCSTTMDIFNGDTQLEVSYHHVAQRIKAHGRLRSSPYLPTAGMTLIGPGKLLQSM